MLPRRAFPAVVALFLLAPSLASASVSITEIMYDAEGADTKHEWIEVWNDGAAFDLSDWKIFEGGSNHGLDVFSGSATIPTGGYAILADDPVTFVADFPSFSGTVFNTAFSGGLSNSAGETLTLRDSELADRDSVTYNPALGAAGDGMTLQKVGQSWQALSPTPGGASGSGSTPTATAEENTGGSNGSNVSSSTPEPTPAPQGAPVEPQIRAFAGEDMTVTAGAAVVFKGSATGLKGEPLTQARFVWSFGDGGTAEGPSVLHTFPYAGKYAVTLDVSSSGWGATDRITVTVVTADLVIADVTDTYVEIHNRSNRDVDIGLWQLSGGGNTFMFPSHTVLLAKNSVKISILATSLSGATKSDTTLRYPNGTFAAGYKTPLFLASAPLSEPKQAPASRTVSAPVENPEIPQEEAAEAAGEVLGASLASSDPVPYWVWFLGLAALIGGGWGAAHLISKRFAHP